MLELLADIPVTGTLDRTARRRTYVGPLTILPKAERRDVLGIRSESRSDRMKALRVSLRRRDGPPRSRFVLGKAALERAELRPEVCEHSPEQAKSAERQDAP
jgi:hypothetical protein